VVAVEITGTAIPDGAIEKDVWILAERGKSFTDEGKHATGTGLLESRMWN
jgi:hypothetical protein